MLALYGNPIMESNVCSLLQICISTHRLIIGVERRGAALGFLECTLIVCKEQHQYNCVQPDYMIAAPVHFDTLALV